MREYSRSDAKMNKWQLVILWLMGIGIAGILFQTGNKLLIHASHSPETWETGYPLTVLAGTAWSYLLPIIIIGILLIFTFKGMEK